MAERLACTRCGGEGHTRSHCPWPDEAITQEKTMNPSDHPRITIQDLAKAPPHVGVDLAARQADMTALYAAGYQSPREVHESGPADVIKGHIEQLKLEADCTSKDIAKAEQRKARDEARLQAINARIREFQDIYHRMLG